MLECVVNISEGQDPDKLDLLVQCCGASFLDLHVDAEHNRSVITLGGAAEAVEADVRRLAQRTIELIDLAGHRGVHPRIGALDVVPFVDLDELASTGPADLSEAVAARDRFASWAAETLGVSCFLYGPVGRGERTLPEVRREAFKSLLPDVGPHAAHPRAGAIAVGARRILVAYNLWVEGGDDSLVRSVAASLRGPMLRTLGLAVGDSHQVSCNLIEPFTLGPAAVYDSVAAALSATAARIDHAELVGLIPARVLEVADRHRWAELGLSREASIEARLESASRRR